MTDPDLIYIGEDMAVRWTGATLTSGTTGAETYANSATVTYALKTAAGAAVASGTGALTYIAASNGNYIGVIESSVTGTLTPGAAYVLELTLAEGDYNGFRRLPLRARYRRDA